MAVADGCGEDGFANAHGDTAETGGKRETSLSVRLLMDAAVERRKEGGLEGTKDKGRGRGESALAERRGEGGGGGNDYCGA